MLEIADSSLTYRSRYLTSMQADLVLDLLLLDEGNPRSAAFQLARLREHVEELPRTLANARRSRRSGERWCGCSTAVQLANAAELMASRRGRRPGQDRRICSTGLRRDLRTLSETIARDYFDHTIASRQLSAP